MQLSMDFTKIHNSKDTKMEKVNHPDHYNQGDIECIDVLEEILTSEQFKGFLKGNALKYLWRENEKNKVEDIKKLEWYLKKWIEHESECVKHD